MRAALAVLHGASHPERDHRLYAHLEEVLAPGGITVVRYDRRPSADGYDVPLTVQADDALAALDRFSDVPVGLWGWSQGAWAALVAARRRRLDFLVLVAACGVSPAAQMLHGTAEQLRRHGFGPDAVAAAVAARRTVDDHRRGSGSRAAAQAAVDAVAGEPWFPLAGLRRTVPAPGTWPDMDFDPAPLFAGVDGPVLAIYGDDDEWIPVDASIAAWRGRATVRRLPGGHEPPIGPAYTDAITDWLDGLLAVRDMLAAAGSSEFDARQAEFERLGEVGCDHLFAARGRPAGAAGAHPRDVAEDLWQAFVVAARRWPDRFLTHVTADPAEAVNICILDALGGVDRPAARDLLVAAATERRAGHALTREYALRSLIRLGDPRLPGLLVRLVSDRASSVRFAAVAAAATHGDRRLLPALRRIAAAERTPPGTRTRAIAAIAAIEQPTA